MEVIYLGHSSFRIKGKSGSLVTDPYDPKMVGLKFPPCEADIVTISHDHGDHNQSQLVKNVKKVINGPGEYEILGISILGFPFYHDDEKGAKRGKNTVYVFEIEGLRVAHLGDLGHELSDSDVEELGDIDILMIPVGGEYTIGPSEATKIVQDIEPTIVLPMHYRMSGRNEVLEPVETFLKEVGLTVEKLPKLVIKKEELGEDQKVVLLELK